MKKLIPLHFLLLLFSFCLATTAPAQAATSSELDSAGNIQFSFNNNPALKIAPYTGATTCTSASAGAIRYNTASKVMEYCNGSTWKSMAGISSTCTRKRSTAFTDDTVIWCPAAYPDLYSCLQLDDQAASTPTDMTTYCPSDGTCSMASGKPYPRTNLGGDGMYYERVQKTVSGKIIEGCVMYDQDHEHLPHRGEILCCSD